MLNGRARVELRSSSQFHLGFAGITFADAEIAIRLFLPHAGGAARRRGDWQRLDLSVLEQCGLLSLTD